MQFQRQILEQWFDENQYETEYNLAESAIRCYNMGELGLNLDDVPLRYGYHKGDPHLRSLLAEQYEGLGIENIAVTCGASEAIICMVMGLLEPGSHVIVEHPNYGSLIDNPRARGCDVSLFTLRHEEDFQPDIERLESMIRPDTRMIVLTHPSNPTGSTISEETLHRLVELAEKHDTLLLFDELYRDFAFDNPLPQAATLSPNVISMNSMSKIYGLPGIRVGWIATKNEEIADTVRTVREHISISCATIGEAIAIQVQERREDFLARARAIVDANRPVMDAWIKDHPCIEWVPPACGINSFPRLKPGVDIDPEQFITRLVKHHKVHVIPAARMEYDPRHFRLGFGCDTDELKTGLSRIDETLKDLNCI